MFSYRVRPYVKPTAVTHLTGTRQVTDEIRRPGAQAAYGRYAGTERIRSESEKTFPEESKWSGGGGGGGGGIEHLSRDSAAIPRLSSTKKARYDLELRR